MFAAGRMDPTKGLHHLLDAYDQLQPALPLLVVGGFEGHNQDYSEQLLARCRATPNLVLIPTLLTQPELFELVAGAKLFVFPSEIEAMSMMLLEVISCGAPVLASDIAENTEVTGPDYPWLFRNADPADLAETIFRVPPRRPRHRDCHPARTLRPRLQLDRHRPPLSGPLPAPRLPAVASRKGGPPSPSPRCVDSRLKVFHSVETFFP